MAKRTNLALFLGTDFTFVFPVLNETETVAVNITGWPLSFMVKTSERDADENALVTVTTPTGIAITGAHNTNPATNTQRATVTIEDSDTDALASGRAHWELKRTDAGFETILGYGEMRLHRGVHRT